MSAQTKPYISPEAYLELERTAQEKHEYYAGEVFAMSGGTPSHALLGANMIALLGTSLRGTGCRVYTSDLRVHIPATGLYTYPDVSVVCGELEYSDENSLLNPVLIVEVLSASTEAYDRGAKFGFYRSIPSLEEYVLIAQDQRHVEVFRKNEAGRWVLHDVEEEIELTSVECRVRLDDLYDGVELPEHPPLR